MQFFFFGTDLFWCVPRRHVAVDRIWFSFVVQLVRYRYPRRDVTRPQAPALASNLWFIPLV